MAAILRDSVARRAYAPTSNTASHDNCEKINSWVSLDFHIWDAYGALLCGPSGRRSSAMKNKSVKLPFVTKNSKHFAPIWKTKVSSYHLYLTIASISWEQVVHGDDVSALIEFTPL